MEYRHTIIEGATLEISSFSKNGVEEIHLFVKPEASGAFSAQLEQSIRARDGYLRERGIPGEALVFSRYFVSDYANQSDALALIRGFSKNGAGHAVVSLVQQPPLTANKAVAWYYLIHDKNRGGQASEVLSEQDLLVRRGAYRHLWSARQVSADVAGDSAAQTEAVFSAYDGKLRTNGLSLRDDCVRTWLFVKDVDFNYKGVVDARRGYFEKLGLTRDTHYIASTGIEGRHADARTNVILDAYSVGGLAPGQIQFLEALENLNPTHEYGVTFERGTSVDYGDRRHILISGTASIDRKGEILHANDVGKQAARAVENIAALLKDADASMQDVAQMIVYLRDIADTAEVKRYFDENYGDIPRLLVLAPVCRPGWLVEIECLAIKSVDIPAYAPF